MARGDTRRDKHEGEDDKKSKRQSHESDDTTTESSMESKEEEERKHNSRRKKKRSSSRRRYSDSESDSDSGSDSSSEERERRRKRRKKEDRERKKEKERKKRKRDEEDDKRRRKKKKQEKKKREKEKGKKGAVTNSWGKYGIVREIDMWNKRPEFTAWLAEVKQVNLESLPNWEEKKMFKEYMEDYNTATFPSKKYYDLDAYHKRKMEKEMKKGFKKVVETERTVFNDEEQRRQELLQAREKQKEQEVEALKNAMKSGMAQAMKEQARLKEEMAYLYKIGNNEAAAAIQKKLDPDVPM